MLWCFSFVRGSIDSTVFLVGAWGTHFDQAMLYGSPRFQNLSNERRFLIGIREIQDSGEIPTSTMLHKKYA